MSKNLLAAALAVVGIILLGTFFFFPWIYQGALPNPSNPPGGDTAVRLYYYNPERDGGPGNIACSKAGLVPVQRVLPSADNVELETLRLLLRGELSDEERGEGIITEFPLPGVSLVSATKDGEVLRLTFSDPENKTGGGSCRVNILRAQIEETAKQFQDVTAVELLPEELFQP